MHKPYGAHEMMEIHEVLTDTIDGINQFQLYAAYCQDPQLQNILQNQIRFMTDEYNQMLQTVKNHSEMRSDYRMMQNTTPAYGMNNAGAGTAEMPNTSTQQMNDHDISSGMLGCAKASATLRMHAALECGDPEIRDMMVQGAANCADQAYETWTYMNNNGYYQVPTLPEQAERTIMNGYQPASNLNNGQLQQ
ncbi:MAG TPA: spore coat protein [Bacillales bacterium]|nr:spore coat protein [Bacillales bacterium]